MPIRFRCAYCNQLMGIARRKAGTIIRCPKCAGQVIVPSPVPESVPGAAGAGQQPLQPLGTGPALFEGSDIEKLFGTQAAAAPPAALPPSPLGEPQAYFDIESLPVSTVPPRAPGIFLTPGKLTVLSVLMVLLLGLAFFLGLLVGRS